MTGIRRRLGMMVVAAGIAGTAAMMSAPAHAEIIVDSDGYFWSSGSYDDYGRPGQFQLQAGDYSNSYGYQQAIVWVSGQDGGNARAECYRGNGTTNWYESTIVARNGTNASHYDCANNGTYNQGLADEAVDLHP
jgi:hypothetical protein